MRINNKLWMLTMFIIILTPLALAQIDLSSLVSYYNFNNSLNLTDYKGINNLTLGTFYPTQTNTPLDRGYNFTAENQSITAADSTSLSITGNLTVGGIFYVVGRQGTGVQHLVSKEYNSSGTRQRSWQLTIDPTGGTCKGNITFAVSSDANSLNGINYCVNGSLTFGTWIDIVATYEKGIAQKVFVNGIEQTLWNGSGTGVVAASIADTTSRLGIGNSGGSNPTTTTLNGTVEEAFVMNRVMMAAEVLEYHTLRTSMNKGLLANQSHYFDSIEGNDSQDCSTPTKACKTISKYNNISKENGDSFYFKCGSMFSKPDGDINWISGINETYPSLYSNYGTCNQTNKPMFTASVNANLTTDWINISNSTWKYNGTYFGYYYIGNLILNYTKDRYVYGSMVQYITNFTNIPGQSFYGMLSGNMTTSAQNYSFYIYSDLNPATKFGDIKVIFAKNALDPQGKDYITIEGLHLTEAGKSGFDTTNNHTIFRNNDVSIIGGGYCTSGCSGWTRWGNGIGTWRGASYNTFYNNKVWEVLDTCLSTQATSSGTFTAINNYWYNNTCTNVNAGIEYFSGSGSTFINVSFTHNTFYQIATSGFESQRTNYTSQTLFGYCWRLYPSSTGTSTGINISDNLCYDIDSWAAQFQSAGSTHYSTSLKANLTQDYNYYSKNSSRTSIYGSKHKTYFGINESYQTINTFALWQTNTLKDLHSVNSFDAWFMDATNPIFELRNYTILTGSIACNMSSTGGTVGAWPCVPNTMAITNSAVTSRADTSLSLAWTNPTESYWQTTRVYVNGIEWLSTRWNTTTITGLTTSTTYNITIRPEGINAIQGIEQNLTNTTTSPFVPLTIITPSENQSLNGTYLISWTLANYEGTEITNQSIILTNPDMTTSTITSYTTGSTYGWDTTTTERRLGLYTITISAYIGGDIISQDSVNIYLNNHIFLPLTLYYYQSVVYNSTCNYDTNPNNLHDGSFSTFAEVTNPNTGECYLGFRFADLGISGIGTLSKSDTKIYYNFQSGGADGGFTTKQNATCINASNEILIRFYGTSSGGVTQAIQCYDGATQKANLSYNAGVGWPLYAYEAGVNWSITTPQELEITSISTVNGSSISTATIYNVNTSNSTTGILPLYIAMLNGTQTLIIETAGNWNKTITYTSTGNQTTTITGITNTYIYWNNTETGGASQTPTCSYDYNFTQNITRDGNYYYLSDGTYTIYCKNIIEIYNYSITKTAGTPLNLTLNLADPIINITQDCGTSDTAMFFQLKDEQNLTDLSGNIYNYRFVFGLALQNYTYYGSFNSTNNFSLCIKANSFPSWTLEEAEIFYSANGYENRRYYVFSGTRLTSEQINVTLYNLANIESTTFTLTIESTNLQSYVDKYVGLVRWYPNYDSYKVVDMGKTDDEGETVVHLELEDVDYRIAVWEKNGSLIYLSNPKRFVCLTSPCTFTLKIQPDSVDYTSFLNIEKSFTYDETTGIWRFVFNDPSQNTNSINMTIYKDTGSTSYEICSSQVSGFTGAVMCNTSTYSGNLRGEITRINGVIETSLDQLLATAGTASVFKSSFGLFLSFILALPILCILVVISPIAGIVGGALALIPAWYLGSIVFAIVACFIIMAGIAIHFVKRATGR